MFELVDQQPSHLACPDVLNLSLGESRGHRAPCLWCGCGVVWATFCPCLSASPGPASVAFGF